LLLGCLRQIALLERLLRAFHGVARRIELL
jgi:hypothetical protein